jgi:hypothetical protein
VACVIREARLLKNLPVVLYWHGSVEVDPSTTDSSSLQKHQQTTCFRSPSFWKRRYRYNNPHA